jgi:ribose 5-phosphate isomerase RpiB
MPQDQLQALFTVLAASPTQTYPEAVDFANALVNAAQVEFGAVASATGSAMTIATNGNPRAVFVYDITQQCLGIHFTGMTAAHVFKVDNAATAHASANGITLGTNQFIIGTDGDINTASDVLVWMVII